MKIAKTLFIALLLIAVTPITAQTAEEIIDNYFENTGGIEAWSAIKSMRFSGKASFGPQQFQFTQSIISDGRMAIEIDLQGKIFIPQAFDGENQWGTNFQSMEAEMADSETSSNYKANDAKDFPDPFLNYAEKGYSFSLIGEETIEGVETYKIKLIKNPILVDGNEEDLFVIYYFDKENFVPIVQESVIPSGPQKGVKVQVIFSDYQEAGSIYYPYTTDVKYNGELAQSFNIKDIEINPEIDESLFMMPVTETEEKKE